MKANLCLMLVALLASSGCTPQNYKPYVPSEHKSDGINPAAALWVQNPSRCADGAVELMTLANVLKITGAWNSYPNLESQPGFEEPKAISLVNTKYPADMLSLGIDGGVYALIQIDKKGKVAKAHAVCASRAEFIPDALEALKHYRYEPAKVNGIAVNSSAFQPIRFIAH